MHTKTAKKTENTKTRIFLVDDHPYLRDGIAQRINREPGLIVCGQAGDAIEALAGISVLKPELAIVDITLPGRDGLELIKDIQYQNRNAVVLVYSMHDESLYAERVLRAGARGYVMKSAPTERIDPSRPSGSRRRNRRGSPDHQPRVNADGDRKPCRRGVAHRTAH